jgi:hypothetical protein
MGCGLRAAPSAEPEAGSGHATLPLSAVVLGETVRAHDADDLRYWVQSRLADRFAQTLGITVSTDEIGAYVRQVDAALERDGIRKAGPSTSEEVAARERIAAAFIRQWKINRALHERYGGRIAYQQGGPEPVDAWRRFLEDSRAQGDFKLADASLEAAFWRYFNDSQIHSFYPPGSVAEAQALRTPPWQNAK